MSMLSGITVLIPFRNEARNLPVIIDALERQVIVAENVEVIWINDESEDDGVAIITEAVSKNDRWKCLQRDGVPGKKSAIHTGILAAQYDVILTTDADCTMDVGWLGSAQTLINQYPATDIIILPVIVRAGDNLICQLQNIESLQLLTLSAVTSALGCPVLCSGANLIFRKSFYMKTYGCRDDFDVASGDDIFLLQQAEKVKLIATSGVVVTTEPMVNWNTFLHQRIRWIRKVHKLKLPRFFITGALVGIWQFSLYLLPLSILLFELSLKPALLFMGMKIMIDIISQWWVASRLKQSFSPLSSLYFALLYPFFQMVILFLSIFIQPAWKGRAIDL